MLRNLIEGLRGLRRGDTDADWRFHECREVVRMRCYYSVGYRSGEKQYKGRIVDMSLGGMKLRCFHPPRVDDVLDILYQGPAGEYSDMAVPCKVQWVRERERDGVQFVGLSYETSDRLLRDSWVKVLLKELGFRPNSIFQRRRFVRAACSVPARVSWGNDGEFQGELCNLGVLGALLELGGTLPLGQEVEIHIGPFESLPAMRALGTVTQTQRAEQGRRTLLGVRFESLDGEQVDNLGRYLRHLLLHHWES